MFTMSDWYERYSRSTFMRPVDMPEASVGYLRQVHLAAHVASHARATLDAQVHSLVHAMAGCFAPPAVETVLHGNSLQHEAHIPRMPAGRPF
jgi:hypothetical protein